MHRSPLAIEPLPKCKLDFQYTKLEYKVKFGLYSFILVCVPKSDEIRIKLELVITDTRIFNRKKENGIKKKILYSVLPKTF